MRQSANDQVLVVGGGVTLHEAMKAADELAKDNIHVRVMDLFTVKPVDKEALIEHAKAAGGRILTVEDHYYEGIVPLAYYRLEMNYDCFKACNAVLKSPYCLDSAVFAVAGFGLNVNLRTILSRSATL